MSDYSVVLRSRVRLARNIVDYPFSPVLDEACRKEIIGKVGIALEGLGFAKTDCENNRLLVSKLSEEHKVSREFATEKELHALYSNVNDGIYIMVCEEDHLRLQAFSSGLDLLGTGEKLLQIEKAISKKIKFAFDNKLGYLTHCPTNLGTAMRASVMMFLPALTISNHMGALKSQLEKIGVTIRGIYGEGSAADAYIYQISNSLSLGNSETDILTKIETVASRIAADETETRLVVFKSNSDKLTDKIMRSLGTLKYAHLISGAEFFDCYAYTRLGISLGVLNLDLTEFDKLLYEAMPAHLFEKNNGTADNTILRDRVRAEVIRKKLQEV